MTRAMVIGGTGFIGRAACTELSRNGVEVVAASRSAQPAGAFESHVVLDRTDEQALENALRDLKPDVVLDCACYQPREMAAVLRHFQGERYIFIATGAIYPDGIDRAAREDDFSALPGEPPDGELAYGIGKAWCETLLQRVGDFPGVSLIPPAVLGAGDPTRRIAAYFRSVEDGVVTLPAETVDQYLGIACVRDVGRACALACDLTVAVTGAYNVAWEGVRARQMLETIAHLLGCEFRLDLVPTADLPNVKGNQYAASASPYGPGLRRPHGLDCTRIRTELGWSASPLDEALAEVADWYRSLPGRHTADPTGA